MGWVGGNGMDGMGQERDERDGRNGVGKERKGWDEME